MLSPFRVVGPCKRSDQDNLDRAATVQLASIALPLVSFIRGFLVTFLLKHQHRVFWFGEAKDQDLRPGVGARVADVLVQVIACFVPFLTGFVLSRLFLLHPVHDLPLKDVDELLTRTAVYGGIGARGYFHREDPFLLVLDALYRPFGYLGNDGRALFALWHHHASFSFATTRLPRSAFASSRGKKKSKTSGSRTCSPKDPSCPTLSKGEKCSVSVVW